MFDKFNQAKQILQMRSKAKQIQQELEQIKHTEEEKGIKVVVNGSQVLTYLEIDGEEKEELMKVINNAMKNVQKKAAKKMLEMGGGLTGLLG